MTLNVTTDLTCDKVGGKPEPTVVIMRDGSVLVSGPPPQTYSFLPQVADDGAAFICNATNSAGDTTATLTTEVSGV